MAIYTQFPSSLVQPHTKICSLQSLAISCSHLTQHSRW